MSYGYCSNWKQIIKELPVEKVFFKFSFTGDYVLKLMDADGYLISPFPGEFGFLIPKSHLRDCIEWLDENNYSLHDHSIIRY